MLASLPYHDIPTTSERSFCGVGCSSQQAFLLCGPNTLGLQPVLASLPSCCSMFLVLIDSPPICHQWSWHKSDLLHSTASKSPRGKRWTKQVFLEFIETGIRKTGIPQIAVELLVFLSSFTACHALICFWWRETKRFANDLQMSWRLKERCSSGCIQWGCLHDLN